MSGNSNTAETAALTGLTPNTEYYFQIKAVNSVTTTYGAVLNFTTTELPGATTSAATSVTATGATLNGSVNAENASTSVSFCYSTTSPTNCSGATVVTASPATATGTSSTTESAALSGLAPGTEYFFQIEATNSAGTTYGSVLNFTTSPAAPSATTSAATSVTGSAATLNGTVSANGASTTVTFCYSTSSALANCSGATSVNASPNTTSGSNVAETAALSSLTPNTEYYFQIKAVNSVTTTYGAVLNFTTTELPGATTSAATSVTATGATLNGSVNAENASTSVSFCYSTTSPTNCSGATVVTASPATATGTSSTTESAALSGLAPGTEYFFQIEATNSAGTTYGSVLNFTTPAAAPTATTNAATSVSGAAATLNGSVNAEGASTTVTYCYSTSSLTNCVGGSVTTCERLHPNGDG